MALTQTYGSWWGTPRTAFSPWLPPRRATRRLAAERPDDVALAWACTHQHARDPELREALVNLEVSLQSLDHWHHPARLQSRLDALADLYARRQGRVREVAL